VNNTNLHHMPVLHRLQDIAQYISKYRFWQGTSL